jgi:mono/diheme cytochrome c family protein
VKRNAGNPKRPRSWARREKSRRLCALAGLLALAGCGYELPGTPNPADRPLIPAQRTSFEFLYQQNCSACHGAAGKLGPAPPLNDPIFLAIVPDEQLLGVITDGRAGTPMPAFARSNQGALTPEQIKIIASGLKKHWKSDKLPEVKLPEYSVTSAGQAPSQANAERGAKVFARACADCHGADGKGTGPDERPGGINNPALLTLISDQALRRIVITGRHDLGMPNFADDSGRSLDFQPLSSDEIADVVALMASWREGGSSAVSAGAKN